MKPLFTAVFLVVSLSLLTCANSFEAKLRVLTDKEYHTLRVPGDGPPPPSGTPNNPTVTTQSGTVSTTPVQTVTPTPTPTGSTASTTSESAAAPSQESSSDSGDDGEDDSPATPSYTAPGDDQESDSPSEGSNTGSSGSGNGNEGSESGIGESGAGSVAQIQRHRRRVYQFKNKHGGKITVVANKNTMYHEIALKPKDDIFLMAEQTRKQAAEERNKIENSNQKESKREERAKAHRQDLLKKRRQDEERRKKYEQRQKTKQYIIRKDLQVFKPEKGRILVDNSAIPASYRFSYLFWVRALGVVPYWGSIFLKGNNNGQRAPGIWLYPGKTRLHLRSATKDAWNDGAVDPDYELVTGKWTHVALTHRDGELLVYLDGRQASSNTNIAAPALNDGPLYVGYGDPANVELADLRYIPRIATPTEIQDIIDQALYRDQLGDSGSGSSDQTFGGSSSSSFDSLSS